MVNMYEKLKSLCDMKGVKPAEVCNSIGASKSLFTDLKTGRKSSVSLETAGRLAAYFGVSVDDILGVVQLSEEEQGMLFNIFDTACNSAGVSLEYVHNEAKISNKTNVIEKLGLGRMTRVSMDDLYAIADVLECRAEVEEFLDKIKKPTAIESDELLRQTDEVKELLKKIAPEQRESVLQMLRTFAAEK